MEAIVMVFSCWLSLKPARSITGICSQKSSCGENVACSCIVRINWEGTAAPSLSERACTWTFIVWVSPRTPLCVLCVCVCVCVCVGLGSRVCVRPDQSVFCFSRSHNYCREEVELLVSKFLVSVMESAASYWQILTELFSDHGKVGRSLEARWVRISPPPPPPLPVLHLTLWKDVIFLNNLMILFIQWIFSRILF